jgi:hypothetical protein
VQPQLGGTGKLLLVLWDFEVIFHGHYLDGSAFYKDLKIESTNLNFVSHVGCIGKAPQGRGKAPFLEQRAQIGFVQKKLFM